MKNNTFRILLLAMLAIITSSFSNPKQSKITYKVKSTHWGIKLTYSNEQGNTNQEDVNDSKWEKTFTAQSGTFLYISAQSEMHNANIKVEILKDGRLIETSESKGDFVIATASTYLR